MAIWERNTGETEPQMAGVSVVTTRRSTGKTTAKVAPAEVVHLRTAMDFTSPPTFDEVLSLIDAAKRRAYQAVNTELMSLYWQVGEYISKKIASAEWGDGVVVELARAIARRYPGLRGFTRSNLFRMCQFFEAYCHHEKVAPLVRQLSWSHHLIILGQCKLDEERLFYSKSSR